MTVKALYTGSFDPLTTGHMNIIKRASEFSDEMTVGIIDNPAKSAMFSLEDRLNMVREAVKDFDNVNVDLFSGLLADYVNDGGFNMVIRGLRSCADFEYEHQMAQINSHLFNDGIETVFLMSDPEYSFLSSSIVKEVFSLGGSIDGLVPEAIHKRMRNE